MTAVAGVSELVARLEANGGKPLRAMIEISDQCNEVCVHCYQVQGQKGELSTEHWRRALDDLAELGVLFLTISGGEATLRADLMEIVAYARELGFLVRLYTNGLRLTRELAEDLRRHAVFEVELSVYSTRSEVHDFVTGVPGSYARTLQAVRNLRDAGVPVVIKTVIMSVNQTEIDAYPAFADALGARFRLDPGGLMPREGYDRAPQALNPDASYLLNLQERLHLPAIARDPAEPSGARRRVGTEVVCGAGREVHVEPNGEVRPCTMLDLKLGDVRAGVRNAYESSAARDLRQLRWRDLHGCRDCDLAQDCARCYAKALAETGDALGPYASACATARRAHGERLGSEPRIIAAEGRTPALGPYRYVASGILAAIDDTVTAEDTSRAGQLAWVRRAEGGAPPPAVAVHPGELVQIRRPGQKSPSGRLTRVPGIPQCSVPKNAD
jgi:radical SAM protein with 4Fe4S-binding SPASM domain